MTHDAKVVDIIDDATENSTRAMTRLATSDAARIDTPAAQNEPPTMIAAGETCAALIDICAESLQR